ncbi:hypothetical protein C8J56DRAFT_1054154 [Mycena floridula]|nr:hypothetical protein C8J56DRAFT_1054154 [Mycena floridula]
MFSRDSAKDLLVMVVEATSAQSIKISETRKTVYCDSVSEAEIDILHGYSPGKNSEKEDKWLLPPPSVINHHDRLLVKNGWNSTCTYIYKEILDALKGDNSLPSPEPRTKKDWRTYLHRRLVDTSCPDTTVTWVNGVYATSSQPANSRFYCHFHYRWREQQLGNNKCHQHTCYFLAPDNWDPHIVFAYEPPAMPDLGPEVFLWRSISQIPAFLIDWGILTSRSDMWELAEDIVKEQKIQLDKASEASSG